jgi:hypothetical protein
VSLKTHYQQLSARVRDDIRSDPKLKYILALSLFVSAFWFWWRIPNFVTPDEYRRVAQPMKVAYFVFSDPGIDALHRLAEEEAGRDATTYLHGLALIPVFILVVLSGELNTLMEAGSVGVDNIFALWNMVPAWFWTASLVVTRLLNVILVVCSVYMTYRIGTELADRQAGRIASIFTALSLAVIHTAHEVNEDTPALFLLLVVFYLSILYVRTEDRQYFLLGCALGGLAIAFKLTAGIAVIFLGTAFVLVALDKPDPLGALWQPRPLIYGLLLGSITIYVGIPNLLLRGPEWIIDARIVGSFSNKTAATVAPQGYNALLAYLNSLGFPLAIASISGGAVTLYQLITRADRNKGEIILLAGLGSYLLVFFVLWQDFSTHHVLPSIPLLVLTFGITLSRYAETRTNVARVVFVVLLLTTSLYAGIGLYQFTNDPRDEAADWLKSNADPDDTVAVFSNSPTGHGLVHGQPIDHYTFGREPGDPGEPYTEWLVSTPDRGPEYIMHSGSTGSPEQHPRRAEFYDQLMNGDHHGYIVAAEFGARPEVRGRISELLLAGVIPTIEKRKHYKIIFAKNESQI